MARADEGYAMKKTLAEIARITGGRLEGDGSIEISGVADIESATHGDITFADGSHLDAAKKSRASALILPEGVGSFPLPAVYVADPRASFAVLLAEFSPAARISPGISDLSHIGAGAVIGKDVTVMSFAVVDENAVIGDSVVLYPHTYVGQYAVIGDGTILYPGATVREHCRIGRRVIIHSSASVGTDGFGFTTKDGVHTKVPQVGNVVVEDDVEIGSHVGIDRATTGSTVIGEGTKIDNLVHIGHNCRIGKHNIIVAQTGISGSTTTGDYVTFGGQTGTVGHIHIGSGGTYAARSGIIADMPDGGVWAGFPVQSHQAWLRMEAAQRKLPELLKRIKALEKKLLETE